MVKLWLHLTVRCCCYERIKLAIDFSVPPFLFHYCYRNSQSSPKSRQISKPDLRITYVIVRDSHTRQWCFTLLTVLDVRAAITETPTVYRHMTVLNLLFVRLFYCAATVRMGAISVAFVRPSVCQSVAYIANNSRNQRPCMPKFGRKVPHLRCDSHTSFKVKMSKVRVRGGRGYTVSAEPGGHTACYL